MKLPDINFAPGAPEIKSGKAAGLNTKLRTIEAGVGAAQVITKTVDNLLDTESKLTAQSRARSAERTYILKRNKISQDYHTSDKAPEGYLNEVNAMRADVFAQAHKDLGGRASSYLSPMLDAVHSDQTSAELKNLETLVSSRKQMMVEREGRELAEAVVQNPYNVQAAVDGYATTLKSAELLSPVEQQANVSQYAEDVVLSAAAAFLTSGDVDGAVQLTQTDAFKQLPLQTQTKINTAVTTAAFKALDVFTDTAANDLILGRIDDIEAVYADIDQRVAGLTSLTGDQPEKLTREAQAKVTERFLNGRILEGDGKTVLAELKDGRYSAVLSPDQTQAILVAASKGGESGTALNVSAAVTTRSLNKIVDAYNVNPLLSDSEYQRGVAELLQLEQQYLAQGKTVPQSVYTQRLDLDDAYADAQTKQRMVRDPQATVQTIMAGSTSTNPAEWTLEQKLAREAAVYRSTALASDPVAFARSQGMVVDDLPDPRSPDYARALFDRLNGGYEAIKNYYGYGVGGPLTNVEADAVTALLKEANATSPDAVLAFAGNMHATLGPDDAYAYWSQLELGDELGMIPLAGRFAADGRIETARSLLNGQRYLAQGGGGFKPKDQADIDTQIYETLGDAYGTGETKFGTMVYDNTVDAINAVYAYNLKQAGGRADGLGYNSDMLDAAIEEVTGGILTFKSRNYAAPRPGVTEDQFENWLASYDETNLPAVIDANSMSVPASEIAKNWYDGNIFTGDRFIPIETGTPGKYFIMDLRGRSRTGERGVPGSLLRSAADPTQAAVIVYDPSQIKARPKRTPKTGPLTTVNEGRGQ